MDILVWILEIIQLVETWGLISQGCFGVYCENNGSLQQTDGQCVCECKDGYSGIFCEYRLQASEWPAGPYGIPRSKEGCPEAVAYGWRQGYIHFTTTLPLTLVANQSSMNMMYNGTETTTREYQTMYNITRPDDFFANYLLGPFGEFSFQFNFCFKLSDHPLSSQTDSWPSGDYSIYGIGTMCPQGFHTYNRSIQLPPLDHWLSDGDLPYFDIRNGHSHASIMFTMCRKDPTVTQMLPIFSTTFATVKELSRQCIQFDGFVMSEESVTFHNIGEALDVNGISFCNYWPTVQYDELYILRNTSSSYLNISEILSKLTIPNGGLLTMYQDASPYWFNIDMSKTVKITHLTTQDGYSLSQYEGKLKIHVINIYISNDKWDFLADGAEFANRYTVLGDADIEVFTFAKPVQGRYLSVMEKHSVSETMMIKSFAIATDEVKQYGNVEHMCNQELGVKHGVISDFQMTASSWLTDHPPYHGRLYHNGWYAQPTDPSPYLQIDFLLTLLVEGITVRNDYKIVERGHQYPYDRKLEPVGCKSFQIMYSTNNTNFTYYKAKDFIFKLDLSQNYTDEQTFSFYKPFLAQFVRVYIIEAITVSEPFLRIELIGCRKQESHNLVYDNTSQCYMKPSQTLYLPEYSMFNGSTSHDKNSCEKQCLKDIDQCGAVVHRQLNNTDYACSYLRHSETELYYPYHPNEFSEEASILVCQPGPHALTSTFRYQLDSNIIYISESVYTHVSEDSVITNNGYPFQYMSDQTQVWHIKFQQGQFIKMIFTNVSLLVTKKTKNNLINYCGNHIELSQQIVTNIKLNNNHFYKLAQTETFRTVIDYTYNDQTPIYDLPLSEVVIIFSTCFIDIDHVQPTGYGFRVIVEGQDIPACYHPTKKEDEVVCTLPAMRLTSSYFLGLEQEFSQEWIIQTDFGKIIELTIIDFYVKCEQTNSVFRIKEVLHDIDVANTYCNMDQPSKLIYSTFNQLTVEFSDKQTQPPSQIFPEGFKASYRSIDVYERIAGLLTHEEVYHTTASHTVCSDLLKKCYMVFPENNITWQEGRAICNKRGLALIVIHSDLEMQFIRALIVRHYSFNNQITKPLYTYIGLTRYIDNYGKVQDIWIDGTVVTYNAWDTLEQPDAYRKQCSRMAFNIANNNNTWQSIDCESSNMTDLLVCQNVTFTHKTTDEMLLTHKNMTTNDNSSVELRMSSMLYQCPRGAWISVFVVCNGYPDCLDGSDETNCTRTSPSIASEDDPSCPAHRFRCNSGRCIDLSKVCDYREDCADGEDEFCEDASFCDDNTFKCVDGRCIDEGLRCDGTNQCFDQSDENSCVTCADSGFQCDDLSCIPQTLICDGYPDCEGGKDENNCDDKSCLQLWQNGFKQAGNYIIGGYNVVCDFENVLVDNRIRTIIKELDVEIIKGRESDMLSPWGNVRTTFVGNILYKDELFIKRLMTEDKLDCSIQVMRTCAPWVVQIADVDDVHRNQSYSFCENATITGQILNTAPNSRIFTNDMALVFGTDLYIRIEGILDPSLKYSVAIECLSEPLSETSAPALKCGVGHISSSMDKRCLYNILHSGYTDGCRSYMHLQQCQDFQCPSRYVKCPSSYCIQPHLICDGIKHCPYGEDENNCKCKPSDSLVTIVYYGHADEAHRRYIFDLGRQLLSTNGEVRFIQVVDTFLKLLDELLNEPIIVSPNSYQQDDRFELLSMLESVGVGRLVDLITKNRPGIPTAAITQKLTIIRALHTTVKDNPEDNRYKQINELLSELDTIIGYDHPWQEEATISEVYFHDNDNIVKNKVRHVYDATTPNLVLNLLNYSIDYFRNDVTKHGIIFINDIIDVTNYWTFIDTLADKTMYETKVSLSNAIYHMYKVTQYKTIDIDIERSVSMYGLYENPNYITIDNFYPAIDYNPQLVGFDGGLAINIEDWNIIGSHVSTIFNELCEVTDEMECTGGYMCMGSRVCIYMDQLCDGQWNCPYNDDEIHCHFFCPPLCQCEGYVVNCSNTDFDINSFFDVSSTTRSLDISFNRLTILVIFKIGGLFPGSTPEVALTNCPFMIKLNISSNRLAYLEGQFFKRTRNLLILDISNNLLTKIFRNSFRDLKYLTTLILKGNSKLQIIDPGAFYGLNNLKDLSIRQASLKHISSNSFVGLNVTTLDLSYNKIEMIENFAFNFLHVKEINIEGNDIIEFNTDIFTGVSSLQSLRTPAFKFCCIRPTYLLQSKCFPEADEFSSCEDLMRNSALQTLLWLIGLASLLGNIMSVIYRLVYDRKRLKLGYGIFVTNLAIADFLMGVYLIMIASADTAFRKRYILMEFYWRNSVWCNMAGVLSTISSEASVFFLLLITLDRILVIKYPFGKFRFTSTTALIGSVLSWIASIIIAFVPLVNTSYFQNLFYTRTGVCLALPLSRDRPPGWMYSIMVFIVFNFVTFLLVACGQLMIFLEVQKQTKTMNRVVSRINDLKIARNLLLIVTTDFLCWFPIGCMGILALNGHVIPGDVYAWTAVLILPINSALNPFLYTMSAMLGNKKFVPRIEEQNTLETTLIKETKQHSSKMWLELLELIFPKDTNYSHDDSIVLTVAELSSTLHGLSVYDCVILSRQLSTILYAIHRCEVSHGHISESTVKIRLTKSYQIGSGIIVSPEPRLLCNGRKEQEQDIYQMGCVIRKLIMLL